MATYQSITRPAGVAHTFPGHRPMPPIGINPVPIADRGTAAISPPGGGQVGIPRFSDSFTRKQNEPAQGFPNPQGTFGTYGLRRPPQQQQEQPVGHGGNYNLGTMELFKNIQGMGGQERNDYLQSLRNSMMQRLQRYDEIRQRGFGGEMGEDAMRDYRAIQQSLNDINRMMTDPAFIAELQSAFTTTGTNAFQTMLRGGESNVNMSDFRRGAY